MVLLDAKGNERAGYLTGDAVGEVWIGLDSEQAQEVTFLANPGGGAHLSFADGKGTGAKLSTVGGRPTLRLVDKGHTVFERPRSE